MSADLEPLIKAVIFGVCVTSLAVVEIWITVNGPPHFVVRWWRCRWPRRMTGEEQIAANCRAHMASYQKAVDRVADIKHSEFRRQVLGTQRFDETCDHTASDAYVLQLARSRRRDW